jgi:hypothetical protein
LVQCEWHLNGQEIGMALMTFVNRNKPSPESSTIPVVRPEA